MRRPGCTTSGSWRPSSINGSGSGPPRGVEWRQCPVVFDAPDAGGAGGAGGAVPCLRGVWWDPVAQATAMIAKGFVFAKDKSLIGVKILRDHGCSPGFAVLAWGGCGERGSFGRRVGRG